MKYLKIIGILITIHLIVTGVINYLYPEEHVDIIIENGRKNKIEPALISAVINVESKFKENANSHKDARGLMQITPDTGKWIAEKMGIESFTPERLYEPELNIKMGSWYLKYLIDYYGNIDTALAAYNAGLGNVDNWLKNEKYSHDAKTLYHIPFSETKNYVKKVNENWEKYKKAYRFNRIIDPIF